ncbi:hypothetical protein MMC28_001775 [Mycoblastus sanguinarius]|nr:hypothetical protein [Mycoblastus sanguinarius]
MSHLAFSTRGPLSIGDPFFVGHPYSTEDPETCAEIELEDEEEHSKASPPEQTENTSLLAHAKSMGLAKYPVERSKSMGKLRTALQGLRRRSKANKVRIVEEKRKDSSSAVDSCYPPPGIYAAIQRKSAGEATKADMRLMDSFSNHQIR